LELNVRNDYLGDVRFTHGWFRITNADGNGNDFRTKKLALSGDVYAPGYGKESELRILFADASSGVKLFPGSGTPIPEDLGFRNITGHFFGKDPQGKRFRIKLRFAVSIGNVNRCN